MKALIPCVGTTDSTASYLFKFDGVVSESYWGVGVETTVPDATLGSMTIGLVFTKNTFWAVASAILAGVKKTLPKEGMPESLRR